MAAFRIGTLRVLLSGPSCGGVEGTGAPWAGIEYHFENVFDWRSGPRRGFTPAPIPTHLP